MAGYTSLFWVSVALAVIAFCWMASNRRVRPALVLPLVLAGICAGPYLMLRFGAPMTGRELPAVYLALFCAPWAFLVVSAVAVAFRIWHPNPSTVFTSDIRPNTFLWGLNLMLPFAILLEASPYIANSDWTHMSAPLRQWVESLGHTTRFLIFRVLINYFVVASVLALVFQVSGVFKWFIPSAFGKGILLLTNAFELTRTLVFAYFIYAWRNETFFLSVHEINQLFAWPLRFAVGIGFGAIIVSSIARARSNYSLQSTP